MTPKNLQGLLIPPITCIELGVSDQWQNIEMKIGSVLPSDYKEWIDIFGTGIIGKFIWIFNPFSKNENLNLILQIKNQLQAIQILIEEFNQEYPYQIFPEQGGLLPWGITENGGVLFWKTDGAPNQWSVIISDSRSYEFEEYQGGVTKLLRELILGTLNSDILREKFFDKSHWFIPVGEE